MRKAHDVLHVMVVIFMSIYGIWDYKIALWIAGEIAAVSILFTGIMLIMEEGYDNGRKTSIQRFINDKEDSKNDRNTKHDCNRDCGTD